MTICSLTRKHRGQEKMSKITPSFLAEESDVIHQNNENGRQGRFGGKIMS